MEGKDIQQLFGVQQKNGFDGMQAIEWNSEASPWVLALAAEINMEKKKRMFLCECKCGI